MGVTLVADGGATSLRMGLVANPPGDPTEPSDPQLSDPKLSDTAALERVVSVPGFQWTRHGDAVEQQLDRLVTAWALLGEPGPVDAVAFGLAGGANDRPTRERLAAAVAARFHARRVYATGDDVTTHLGVLGGEPGVVIAAGTGTLCLAVTPDGQLCNVDGLGYLFGDLGSGFALGLAGIRAALAAVEARGPATSLVAPLAERVGEPVRQQVKRLYESATVIADVASFAEVVTAAADHDEVAAALCRSAGADLAADVVAALRQAFPDAPPASVPVSWSGSVLRSSRTVFDSFAAALTTHSPCALPSEPRGDSIAGAVRLSTGERVPHLAAVVSYDSTLPTG